MGLRRNLLFADTTPSRGQLSRRSDLAGAAHGRRQRALLLHAVADAVAGAPVYGWRDGAAGAARAGLLGRPAQRRGQGPRKGLRLGFVFRLSLH